MEGICLQIAMSADDVSILREDIAALKAVLEERSRTADRNSTLLRTVIAIVALQLIGSVYLAGVKVNKLDTLSDEVASIRQRIESLTINTKTFKG
jgi:Asp-tRNA(Asn)/Glu-tRNA(Gln) amidotransferase B subunit